MVTEDKEYLIQRGTYACNGNQKKPYEQIFKRDSQPGKYLLYFDVFVPS